MSKQPPAVIEEVEKRFEIKCLGNGSPEAISSASVKEHLSITEKLVS